MIGFLIVLCVLVLWKAKIVAVNKDYLERSQTDAVKGFFILMVFLSHIRGYISGLGKIDGSYLYYDWLLTKIGQRMVVMFLFYSGYGVMEALQNRPGYLDTFLSRRVFPAWFHFAIGLIPFIAMNWIMGFTYPMRSYVLCWTGWESIGNSNWYIFDILVLYLLTWAVFRFGEKSSYLQRTIVLFFASALFAMVLKLVKQSTNWYNTVQCYPLGVFVSLEKKKLEEDVLNNHQKWMRVFLAVMMLFLSTYFVNNIVTYTLNTWCFCLAVVLLSMRMKIGNQALEWCGKHLFPIYILQRVPMKILSNTVHNINPVLLTATSLMLTIILAAGFQSFSLKVDSLLRRVA